MQGKHRASDRLHTKPTDHVPADVAVLSSNTVQTSSTLYATGAAHTSHMAQISTQTHTSTKAQTSAGSAQCCSASGIMPRMFIMAISSSLLTLTGRCGGGVTSAPMATLMSGKLVLQTDPVAGPAHSVQAREFVSTIHWPPSILTLLWSLVTETRPQLMTTQLRAIKRCCGNANMDMSMLLQSRVGHPTKLAVPNVLPPASHHSPSRSILF